MPTAVLACTGGGSNAIGGFAHYIDEPEVRLIGVDPSEAATMAEDVPAVIYGFKCLTLLDQQGQPNPPIPLQPV